VRPCVSEMILDSKPCTKVLFESAKEQHRWAHSTSTPKAKVKPTLPPETKTTRFVCVE
jgi:hypothetical protein